jgi:hypothetical protein
MPQSQGREMKGRRMQENIDALKSTTKASATLLILTTTLIMIAVLRFQWWSIHLVVGLMYISIIGALRFLKQLKNAEAVCFTP